MSHSEGEAAASQQAESNTGSKVRAERVALLVLSVLLVAVAVVIYRLSFAHFQTNKNLQMLKDENEAMRKNLTEKLSESSSCTTEQLIRPKPTEARTKNCTVVNSSILVKPTCLNESQLQTCMNENEALRKKLTAEPCPTCEPGWNLNGGSCYYFSSNYLTWDQSRSVCKGRGADLVQIDSEEEQRFLNYEVGEKMTFSEDKFWIGLTDRKEEGRWLWVDDSPLNTSLSFWNGKEPDNLTIENPAGEHCVRMGKQGGATNLKCWSDRSCYGPQKSICEKAAKTG